MSNTKSTKRLTMIGTASLAITMGAIGAWLVHINMTSGKKQASNDITDERSLIQKDACLSICNQDAIAKDNETTARDDAMILGAQNNIIQEPCQEAAENIAHDNLNPISSYDNSITCVPAIPHVLGMNLGISTVNNVNDNQICRFDTNEQTGDHQVINSKFDAEMANMSQDIPENHDHTAETKIINENEKHFDSDAYTNINTTDKQQTNQKGIYASTSDHHHSDDEEQNDEIVNKKQTMMEADGQENETMEVTPEVDLSKVASESKQGYLSYMVKVAHTTTCLCVGTVVLRNILK